MASWVNRVVVAAPRNGTTTHTIDPSSATNVVDGAAFTPTAGRLLVVIVEGSVTSTTPTGWTLPTGGSAVNNTGLYVWYRTAAGGDTFTTTHNGSNYPVAFEVLEFSSGSAFVKSVAATGVAYTGGAGPTLSGLTGTNDLIAVAAQGLSVATTETVTWSAGTKTTQVSVGSSGTDGYTYSTSVLTDSALTSWSSAATFSSDGGFAFTAERLVFAVNGAAGGGSNAGTVSASLPKITGSVSGAATNAAALAAALPLIVGSLTGTATNPGTVSASVPVLTGAVSGQSVNPGTVAASLPVVTGALTGTATNSGTVASSLPRTTGALTGTATNAGTISGALPKFTGQISDQTGNAGALTATLPKLTASVAGSSTNAGTVGAALPVLVSVVTGGSSNPASLAAILPVLTGALAGSSTNPGTVAGVLPLPTAAISDAVLVDITVTVTGPTGSTTTITGPTGSTTTVTGPTGSTTTITGPEA